MRKEGLGVAGAGIQTWRGATGATLLPGPLAPANLSGRRLGSWWGKCERYCVPGAVGSWSLGEEPLDDDSQNVGTSAAPARRWSCPPGRKRTGEGARGEEGRADMGSIDFSRGPSTMAARSDVWSVLKTSTGSIITTCHHPGRPPQQPGCNRCQSVSERESMTEVIRIHRGVPGPGGLPGRRTGSYRKPDSDSVFRARFPTGRRLGRARVPWTVSAESISECISESIFRIAFRPGRSGPIQTAGRAVEL
jgi:hypothetical protein